MIKTKSFFLALVLFVIFDSLWLGVIMKEFNMNQLAEIGRINNGVFDLNYPAAIFTYILMALAYPFYVLPILEKKDSVLRIFLKGALMGFIVYGVFDMTNLAILKNYPLAFIAPDMTWGTFLFGLIAVIMAKTLLWKETKSVK